MQPWPCHFGRLGQTLALIHVDRWVEVKIYSLPHLYFHPLPSVCALEASLGSARKRKMGIIVTSSTHKKRLEYRLDRDYHASPCPTRFFFPSSKAGGESAERAHTKSAAISDTVDNRDDTPGPYGDDELGSKSARVKRVEAEAMGARAEMDDCTYCLLDARTVRLRHGRRLFVHAPWQETLLA